MKIKVFCGKGPGGIFVSRCQGRIELSGDEMEPGLVMQLIQEFYVEHEHAEIWPPDDPESGIVAVTDEEWERAKEEGIGLVEEGVG